MEIINIITGMAIGLMVWIMIDHIRLYSKTKKQIEKQVEPLKEEEYVSCRDCGALMKKGDVRKVNVGFSSAINYCGKCKPPYDQVSFGRCFKIIEVDRNGEPIGYTKKK